MSSVGSDEAWEGERGHIDAEVLERRLGGVAGAIYYLTGPPGMVQGLRRMLVDAGTDEDDIRTRGVHRVSR